MKGQNLRANIDKREINSGEKKWYHVKRGVPVRVEIGIKELEQNMVSYSCRDNSNSTLKIEINSFVKNLPKTLQSIQTGMLESARKKLSENTKTVTTLDNFKQAFQRKDKLDTFVIAPFLDNESVEKTISELGVTVRCIPLAQPKVAATCLFTGQPTKSWALYAKSY